MTEMANAIILVVDRLSAGYLGPYGNTWIETPCWNSLAARAALFEWCLADAVDLPTIYRSYWFGHHALSRGPLGSSLPEAVARAGIHSALITDEPSLLELPGATAFVDRIAVKPATVDGPAVEIYQTRIAQLLATAAEHLQRMPEPFLAWVHARGMSGPWDAPIELRNQFADEDDPEPPTLIEPPQKRLDEGHDPDELLGYQQAYAGQIALLDLCLEAFFEAARALPGWDRTLLVATSPRGYPLGEHGVVGGSETNVYEEQTHVPCVARLPLDRHAGVRCRELVQPPDLCGGLWRMWGLAADGAPRWGQDLLAMLESESPTWRDRAASVSAAARALRSPAWLLVCRDGAPRELFAKPDDRYEVNEVASRCAEAADQLELAWNEFHHAAQSAPPPQLSPLSDLLRDGLA